MDGVSLMKAAITHVEQKRRETAVQGANFFERPRTSTPTSSFKWEGDDLVVDNTNVCHCGSLAHALLGRSHQVSSQDGMVT